MPIMQGKFADIKKSDDELQVVYGEVYIPDFPDSDGDFMTAETIREAAYKFMRESRLSMIDTQHDNEVNGSYVVESFIAREGDDTFIEGSWVVGVYVPDKDLWERVKSGEINGFSIEALAISEPTEIEIDVPAEITGNTSSENGHTHTFSVAYSDDGEFLGGVTDVAMGHSHKISRGTVTDVANGHRHKFAYLDAIK